MAKTKRVVLIAGPTASGKSALALDLARVQDGVVINADSMQVYRELRILTARPTPEEESELPHRLYGCIGGAEPWSVGKWLEAAKLEIESAWASGRLPILVGGTGLYFKSLEEGLADIPPIPPAIREKWREESGNLHGALQQRDPQTAARLKPGDRQRIKRALEVVEATGKPLGYWHDAARSRAILANAKVERVLTTPDRQELYVRARARFARMVERGAIEEVRRLLELDLPPSQPVMKGIGVRELANYIHGKLRLDEAISQAQTSTRQYIKRQLTWWRHQTKGWEERR
jgi:tRNA dimethylallyltransferase